MFDPVSISAFATAAKGLANLKDHFVSEEKKAVLDFIEFCQSVHSILQSASEELKNNNLEELGAIGARLAAWARTDKFVDAALKEQRDRLSASLKSLSAELINLRLGQLSAASRREMQRQFSLLSGELKGLIEVLRYENDLPQAAAVGIGFRKTKLTKWFAAAAATTAGTVFTAVGTQALAKGVENLPGAGPILAEWIRGSSDGDDTTVT